MAQIDYDEIYDAITYSESHQLRELLNQPGVDINFTDNHSRPTFLHTAIKSNELDCIDILFEYKNLNINIRNPDMMTPLQFAASLGKTDCVRRLLGHGDVRVNDAIVNGPHQGKTPLHLAAANGHIECVQLLLNAPGIDANLEDADGLSYSELMIAHNTDDVDQLRNSYSNVNKKDADGNTELHRAILKKNFSYVIVLLQNDNINIHIKNKKGKTQLQLMIVDDLFYNNAKIKQLIDFSLFQYDNDGMTPLHRAAKDGNIATLKTLLKNKFIDVNAPDTYGWTPLIFATYNEHLDCIKELLKHKDINVNAQTDKHRQIPDLFPYIRLNTYGSLRMTIPDCTPGGGFIDDNNGGFTAVHYAVTKNCTECLKLLLKQPSIAVTIQDKNGLTALHYAAVEGKTDYMKLLLDTQGISVNAQTTNGRTALHYAGWNQRQDCFLFLLKQPRINVNLTTDEGYTTLHYVCAMGHAKCVEALLEHKKTDVNVQDKQGYRALHYAAAEGNVECLRALINRSDVNINQTDND